MIILFVLCRGGRRGRGRRVINYHDLDAPEDMY